ncbi:MAG: hypothetical protein AB1439_03730 [candidate division FCPU426 bacterium]
MKKVLLAKRLALGMSLALLAVRPAGAEDALLQPGITMHLGAGYMQPAGEISEIWGGGLALDAVIGYKPLPWLGLEVGGIYGYTGITERMKNQVYVYYPSTGDYGDRESTGGNFYAWFFGPRLYYQLPGTDWVASLAGGGSYYGEAEAGLDEIDGYTPRWTFGWGGYAETGLSRYVPLGNMLFSYGLKFRYTFYQAKVNDFYYDRVFNAMSFDAIPDTYLQDQRWQVLLDIGFDFY